jgi:hypothetical protein
VCAALWPDLWLMAPHSLEEVFAADCLLPALYLVELRKPRGDVTRVALAGFLLGAAFVFRLQLAPAIALAGVFLCRRNARYWYAALAASALPVVAAGLLDWATWGQPFRSFWLNIDLNLFHDVAALQFGRDPVLFYVQEIVLSWMWSLPLIAVLCWRGARRLPVFGWTALVILAVHTALTHKEMRFIFPALAVLAVLACIGLAGTLDDWRMKQTPYWHKLALTVLLAGPFFSPLLVASLASGISSFDMFESVKSDQSGVVATNDYQRAYMPLDILFIHPTLVEPMTGADIARLRPGLILSADPGFEAAGYHRGRCFDTVSIRYFAHKANDICIWVDDHRRAGIPPAPGFMLDVPAKAQPFEVIDRLFPDQVPDGLSRLH